MDHEEEKQEPNVRPASLDEVEKELVLIRELIKRVPEEYRSDAASMIIREAVIFGSFNHFEALGILEEAKLEYREISMQVLREEDEE